MTVEPAGAAASAEGEFWREGRNVLLQRLEASSDGLSDAEAAERLRRYGPNLAVTSLRRGLPFKIAKRLVEPLIAILLIAALISGATGDWQSLIIIVLIVLASIALDVFQETQAENAVDALRRAVAVQVTALRSGRRVEIPVRDVVAGDVLALHAGDLVPADALILES
ncbi:MAG: magnesium-translocating P-type ATPase, partial [Bosea sp.]|nr:magnesium-translocating P-type ATPase [Bosea sp. (in: a-proteobacteria)]